jgi:hypothetical protein
MHSADISSIFDNILASGLWFILGLAAAGTFNYFRRGRLLRSIWQLPKGTADVSVAVSTLQPQNTGLYSRPTSGLGALIATASVSQSLADTYHRHRPQLHIHFSDGFPSNLLHHPLIIVGGPRYNSISERLLGNPLLRFRFEIDQPSYILDHETGATFRPTIDGERVIRDFALVTRCRSPYDANQFALVLAGVHTYGVAAAALVMTSGHTAKLARTIRKLGDTWQVLIEVEVVENESFPKIIASSRTPS